MAEQRDRILMCPPDYFRVEYVINPWMAGHEGSLDISLAKKQWQTLRDTLAEHADIVTIDPQPDLPDMVFTANAGVVYGNKAIASHFMPQERRPEEPHFKKWFRDNGFELLDLEEKIGFEGAGDCLLDRGAPRFWVGYGFRTEIEAHPEIRKWFGIAVVSLRLTDSRFSHIATCFCPPAAAQAHRRGHDGRRQLRLQRGEHRRQGVPPQGVGSAQGAAHAGGLHRDGDRSLGIPEGGRLGQVPDAEAERAAVLHRHRHG